MRIGLLSDTHDNIPLIRRACELFNHLGVDMVIHCGDYIAPFSLNPMNEILGCSYSGVFGNNDGERDGLIRASGGKIEQGPKTLHIGGWDILVCHQLPNSLPTGEKGYRLIAHGHTHIPAVKMDKDCLLVNPGECCGWLYGGSTVAVVDLERLTGEIIKL